VSIASRLLSELEASHRALTQQGQTSPPVDRALHAVYEAVAAAFTGVGEDVLVVAPVPDEWSMAEIVEHLVEHDRHFMELESRGLAHYVEHGLEHALQLWRLRSFHLGDGTAPN
jgi:hypothetical protein